MQANSRAVVMAAVVFLAVFCTVTTVIPSVDAVDVSDKESLSSQISDAVDGMGTEIKLTTDLTLESTLEIPVSKIITLNLGGHTLTYNGDAAVITNNGILTVKNGSVLNNGTGVNAVAVLNNKTLTIDQDAGSTTLLNARIAILNHGTTTVNDGTVKTELRYGVWSDSSDAVLTVNNGTFTSSNGTGIGRTICTPGSVNIYGGSFTSYGSSGAGQNYVDTIRVYNGGTLTIDPRTDVKVTSITDYAVSIQGGSTAYIKGGDFTCEGDRDEMYITSDSQIHISGGTFAHEPDIAMLTENALVRESGGRFIVDSAEPSEITVSDYASFKEAVDGTLSVFNRITLAEGANIVIPAGESLELNYPSEITIPSGSSLRVAGVLNLSGQLVNKGTLSVDDVGFISGVLNVTGDGSIQGYPKVSADGLIHISTPMALQWLSHYVEAGNSGFKVILDESINLPEDVLFTPIGSEVNFASGLDFDGNGKTISGLNVYSRITYGGLFGTLNDSSVHDLTISGADIRSSSGFIGVLAGIVFEDSVFTNITVENSTVHSNISYGVGGLFGSFYGRVDESQTYEEIVGCRLSNVDIRGYANTGAIWGTSSGYPGNIGVYNTVLNGVKVTAINVNAGVLGGFGHTANVQIIGLEQTDVTVTVKDVVQTPSKLVSASDDTLIDDKHLGSHAVKDGNGYWVALNEGEKIVAQVGNAEFTALDEAFSAAGSGETIVLLDNITDCPKITLDDGRSLILDLNGKTITFAVNSYFFMKHGNLEVVGEGTVKEGSPYYGVFMIETPDDAVSGNEYVHLIIRENVFAEGWSPVFIDYNSNSAVKYNAFGVVVDVYGTLNGVRDKDGAIGSGFYVNGTINQTSDYPIINIYEGAVVNSGPYVAGFAEVNIMGGMITSDDTGIEIRAGKLNISGGTITSNAKETVVKSNNNGSSVSGAGVAVSQHTTVLPIDVRISGGKISGPSAFYQISPEPNNRPDLVTLSITGGEFVSTVSGEGYYAVYSKDKTSFITGGLFRGEIPEGYVAASHTVVQNGDGSYSIVESVTVTFDLYGEIYSVKIAKGGTTDFSIIADEGYAYTYRNGDGTVWDRDAPVQSDTTVYVTKYISRVSVSIEIGTDDAGVVFRADVTTVEGATPTYAWTLPGGQTSDTQGVSVTEGGRYAVSVTVTDNEGVTGSASAYLDYSVPEQEVNIEHDGDSATASVSTGTVVITSGGDYKGVDIELKFSSSDDVQVATIQIDGGEVRSGAVSVTLYPIEEDEVRTALEETDLSNELKNAAVGVDVTLGGIKISEKNMMIIKVPIARSNGLSVSSAVAYFIEENGDLTSIVNDRVEIHGDEVWVYTDHNTPYIVVPTAYASPDSGPSPGPGGDDEPDVPDYPVIVPDDPYVPPMVVIQPSSGSGDDATKVAAVAAAAVVAAILAAFIIMEFRKR